MNEIKFNTSTLYKQYNENLKAVVEVVHPEEAYYNFLEQRFNIRIVDADDVEESILVRIMKEYDGRFVAVMWDEEPTDEEVSEVEEFIFGDKTLVFIYVSLIETLSSVDLRGNTHTYEAVVSTDIEDFIFINKGYRDTRTYTESINGINEISERLSKDLYNKHVGV